MTAQRSSTPSVQHTTRRTARVSASRPLAAGALMAAGLFLVTGCAVQDDAAPETATTSSAALSPTPSPAATPSAAASPTATPAPSPAATPDAAPEPAPAPASAPASAPAPAAAPSPAAVVAPPQAPPTLTASPVPAPQPVVAPPAVQGAAAPATGGAQALFAALNSARASAGLAPLVYSSALEGTATTWSASMSATGVMSHNPGVEGQIPGGWLTWGENVAYAGGHADNAATIHDNWMNSPLHRDNILRSSFTQVGIGYVVDAAGTAWATQVFAGY